MPIGFGIDIGYMMVGTSSLGGSSPQDNVAENTNNKIKLYIFLKVIIF
tara:strand:+ start:1111 stop:1254 length:144 start_codon:yes stop_codon:yes gene_type:complete